jgi:conjugal transfer pilin signal peptidase TrbI
MSDKPKVTWTKEEIRQQLDALKTPPLYRQLLDALKTPPMYSLRSVNFQHTKPWGWLPNLLNVVWSNYKRYSWWLWLPVCALLVFAMKYKFAVNLTPSLPYSVAIIEKGHPVLQRGDLAVFSWQGGWPFPKGAELFKRVGAVAGDEVISSMPGNERDRELYHSILKLKTANGGVSWLIPVRKFSEGGQPLQPGPVGIIPDQHYYMQGEHERSLDSRYSNPGWVRGEEITGKVVWAW